MIPAPSILSQKSPLGKVDFYPPLLYNDKTCPGRESFMIRPRKAFIFDMDGVLLDSMPYHYLAWQEAFRSLGIEIDQREIYLREGEQGRVTAREISEKKGKRLTEEEIERLVQLKESIFQQICPPRVFDGVGELLEELKEKGKVLGLVTGTSQAEVRKILPPNLLILFDTLVTGDQVSQGKPAPDPYLKAMERLRLSAQDCLVIENSPNGILAAKRAGLDCVALTTSLPKQYLSGADLVLEDWGQLRSLLLRL